ncbi:hypothetical protein Cgig2_017111 [Carnegiea gigantea]|uniref:Uncharacterized protein n=1 Tax=Carnegiea gigantea TaxID=171969 RepID=A0A9Q1JN02_9CARY|nr:hypothetical protein Cgig2_017111 [Carnegiea gigantea]
MACVWVLNVSHRRLGAKFEVEEEKGRGFDNKLVVSLLLTSQCGVPWFIKNMGLSEDVISSLEDEVVSDKNENDHEFIEDDLENEVACNQSVEDEEGNEEQDIYFPIDRFNLRIWKLERNDYVTCQEGIERQIGSALGNKKKQAQIRGLCGI